MVKFLFLTAVFLSQPLQASPFTSKAQGCFAELNQLRAEFGELTDHYPHCSLACEDCLEGMGKLVELAKTSETFPSPNFDIIVITEFFEDVNSLGHIDIDHKATLAEIEHHLSSQTDEYSQMNNLQRSFNQKFGHYIHCSLDPIAACIDGMEKLTVIAESGAVAFPNPHFDLIVVSINFQDVNSLGHVDIDHRGSEAEITNHLNNQ